MIDYLDIEVVTENPSNIKIFQDRVLLEENDFIKLKKKLGKDNWLLVSSHAYTRNNFLYEKYYFVQK